MLHPPGEFPLEFVRCVFERARTNARDKEEVYKGTKAFVELSGTKGLSAFIRVDDVKTRAGITRKGGSAGLWPWLARQAGVVEEQSRPKAFRIQSGFREAMKALFPDDSSLPKKRSILELEGKGQEIWEGIDAQDHVDRERNSWIG